MGNESECDKEKQTYVVIWTEYGEVFYYFIQSNRKWKWKIGNAYFLLQFALQFPAGRGFWGGSSAPSPEYFEFFDVQMVCFGVFWGAKFK